VYRRSILCVAFLASSVSAPAVARGEGTPAKFALYGLRITPSGTDAEQFSDDGWGVGINFYGSPDVLMHGLAFGAGCEFVNLMSQTTVLYDPDTLLRTEQETSQDFFRIYLGPEIGPHGHGFFRPFAGANIAVHFYRIGTQLIIPDDVDPSQSIVQDLGNETNTSFGYDFTVGADLQVKRYFIESGVRFIKSFNLPQQFGNAAAVTIHPGYFQIFIGLGGTVW